MIALNLFLAMQPNPAQPVLDRFRAFMTQTKGFTVQIAATSNLSRGTGNGLYGRQRPDRARFEMTWGSESYLIVANGTTGFELERRDRVYDELVTDGTINGLESNVSGMYVSGMPAVFQTDNLEQLAPPNTPYRLQHAATAKEPYDTVIIRQGGSNGPRYWVTASIDKAGRPVAFRREIDRLTGVKTYDYKFTNYRINPAFPKDFFNPPLPPGAVPFSIPYEPLPPNPDEPLKLGTWSKAGGGSFDLGAAALSKATLLVMLDPDSPPSAFATKDLPNVRSAIKGSSVDLFILVRTNSAAEAKRVGGDSALYTTSTKLWDSLRNQGTPSYFLLRPGAKMYRLWQGWDEEENKLFLVDLKEAAVEVNKADSVQR